MTTADISDSIAAGRKPKPPAAVATSGLPLRRRESPWLRRLLVFAACVLLADALFGERGLAQTVRARRDYAQAVAGLAGLRHENAALRERARRLQDDPSAIEAVAREELGLIRPGEILVVVKDLH